MDWYYKPLMQLTNYNIPNNGIRTIWSPHKNMVCRQSIPVIIVYPGQYFSLRRSKCLVKCYLQTQCISFSLIMVKIYNTMSYVNAENVGELYSDHAVLNAVNVAKIKLFCFSQRLPRSRRTMRKFNHILE